MATFRQRPRSPKFPFQSHVAFPRAPRKLPSLRTSKSQAPSQTQNKTMPAMASSPAVAGLRPACAYSLATTPHTPTGRSCRRLTRRRQLRARRSGSALPANRALPHRTIDRGSSSRASRRAWAVDESPGSDAGRSDKAAEGQAESLVRRSSGGASALRRR